MKNHKGFSNSSVIITGLARDTARVITNDINNLLASFSDFTKVHFYIVESDSSDETVRVLRHLKNSILNFEFHSLGTLSGIFPDRIERLSYCRQFTQNHIRASYSQFDYVCVSDLDGTNSILSKNAVQSCWRRDDWEVCTANQKGPYYDIYALRHPTWSKRDYWEDVKELESRGVHPMKSRRIAVHKKQIEIPPESEWIEVQSAFGGLAIYKMESYLRGQYSSKDEKGLTICEHVPFHTSMRRYGSRIFINPRLLNHQTKRFKNWKARIRYIRDYVYSFLFPKKFMK